MNPILVENVDMIARYLVMTAVLICAGFANLNTCQAAVYGAKGTFVTPVRSGAVKFVAVKRVVQFNGYQGNMTIAGKTFPGVMYGLKDGSGRIGFVWYYTSDYAQAGSTFVSIQPDGTWQGQIDFTNHKGVVTETGVTNLSIVF